MLYIHTGAVHCALIVGRKLALLVTEQYTLAILVRQLLTTKVLWSLKVSRWSKSNPRYLTLLLCGTVSLQGRQDFTLAAGAKHSIKTSFQYSFESTA